jgi:hypothetical protein
MGRVKTRPFSFLFDRLLDSLAYPGLLARRKVTTPASKSPAKPSIPAALSTGTVRAIQALAWPDAWASDLKLAVDGHPFDLRGREYERDILRDESEWIIVPKGAQLGLTTTFLLRTCHWIKQRGWHHLYLLPLKTGSVTFVQGRIDPIIESNKNLASLFSRTDNRNHKQSVLGTNWYIRGTNIETELREIPVDVLIVDERDKANEENLHEHAYERLGGSLVGRIAELSTPTVPDYGVYGEDAWGDSDKRRWWVPCPHCGSKQVLNFEENVLPWIDEKSQSGQCRCSHCKALLTDDDRGAMNEFGEWVPDEMNGRKRGYHITQLNSPTRSLDDMLSNYFKGAKDSQKMAAFMRNALGLPYTAEGDKFTVQLLDSCRSNFQLGGLPMGSVYLGIDVGHDALHLLGYTVDSHRRRRQWACEIIQAETGLTKWEVLERDYLKILSSYVAVIDGHPDKEAVENLSKKYPGKVWMALEKDRPDQPETAKYNQPKWGEVGKVNIDRTMAFDGVIGEYLKGQVLLPANARELGEHMPKLPYGGFYAHMMAQTRVEQADASGRIVARWVNGYSAEKTKTSAIKSGKKPDHWHHADMFSFVATLQDAPMQVPAEVGELFEAAGGFIG